MFLRRWAVLALCGAALAACDSLTTATAPEPLEGARVVRFAYAGADSGSFEAAGPYPGAARAALASFAVGADLAALGMPNTLVVLASQRQPGGTAHVFSVAIKAMAGTGVACAEADVVAGTCPIQVEFATGYDWYTDRAEREYRMRSGTLQISSRVDRRLVGTFSAEMERVSSGQRLTITSGYFDVTIEDADDIFTSVRKPAGVDALEQRWRHLR